MVSVYTSMTRDIRIEIAGRLWRTNVMTKLGRVLAVSCWLAMAAMWLMPAAAQSADMKEKPALYTYVADWAIPRAQWGDEDKLVASEQKMLEKAMADGTIVAYGSDQNLIHRADGYTHDTFFSATSMAGLLHVLDQVYKSGVPTSPVQVNASKHEDAVFVSHNYNWHSGAVKDGYTHGAIYKLKADAPDDAVETLSTSLIVPLMEKMLADGAISEYEVDTEAIHTDAPGTFFVFYIAPTAEGLDKVTAGLQAALKANPLGGPAFESMVDSTAHRDELARTSATYK